jgi:hypothetical protein
MKLDFIVSPPQVALAAGMGDAWEPPQAVRKTSLPKLADIQGGDQYLKAKASIGETYTTQIRHKTAI